MFKRTLPFDFSMEYWEVKTLLDSRPSYKRLKYFIRNARYILAGPSKGLVVRIYSWLCRLDETKKRLEHFSWAQYFDRIAG